MCSVSYTHLDVYKRQVLDGAVRGSRTRSTLSRFDRIATGSRWGKPLALGIILVGLLATFVPAMPIKMCIRDRTYIEHYDFRRTPIADCDGPRRRRRSKDE